MYRIAICDNEIILAKQHAAIAQETFDIEHLQCEIDYCIDLFSNPYELQQKLLEDGGYYQLLMLDIQMDDANGVELARLLRDRQVKCSLIYITAYREYVFDSFDTRPLQYLLKPVDRKKLSDVLIYDYKENYKLGRSFFEINNRRKPIPFADIYYVEAAQHRVNICLCDEEIPFNSSLSAVECRFPMQEFCRSHISFLVNLSHISEIFRYEIMLDNGKSIPISRRSYNSVLDAYIAHMKR